MIEWYFAYGSNLLIEQMIRRTGPVADGDDRPRRAFLPDHRLAFDVPGDHGDVFANIRQPGKGVHGVLYGCTPQGLKLLDEYEQGYERRRVTVVEENGNHREAFAYVAGPAGLVSGRTPGADYLWRILTGARQHGLPETYVRDIETLAASPD